MGKRRLFIFMLVVQLISFQASYAQGVPETPAPTAPSSPVDLDLSSVEKNVSAASVLQSAAEATINLAGMTRTVTAVDMLTAAEMVAVRQVVNTGNQYLQLNDLGAAIGGGLHLQYYASNGLGNLVIPEGVRASQNASMLDTLNLSGNLTNSGVFNIFSSNPAVNSATINASNIFNNANALISSTLANLNLNAVNNIVNAGTIMSAGNLSMTAGGSITNMGVMQAVQNLSMQASTITNQAQMAAIMGNVNAVTANLVNSGVMQALAGKMNVHGLTSDLNVNNLNGVMSAARELSFINDSVLKPVLNVTGGTISGSEVKFDANDGHLNVQVSDLAGDVHVKGGTAKFGVSAGTHPFNMASWTLTGDPDLILNVASYTDSGAGFNADGGVVEITTTVGAISFTGDITTTATTLPNNNSGHVWLNSATSIDTANIDTSAGGTGYAGDILLTAATTLSTGNVTANAGTNAKGGTIRLTAGTSVDIGATSDVGSAANPVQVSTPVINVDSTNGSVYLNSLPTTNVELANAGANGTLQVLANGNLNVTGPILASIVTLGTIVNNGNLSLENSILANAINLSASGTGSITQDAGQIVSANTITLTTDWGSIGTESDPISAETNNLVTVVNSYYLENPSFSFTPPPAGSGVFVANDSTNLNLSGNGAGHLGVFSLTTTGDLTIQAGSTIGGVLSNLSPGIAVEITAGGDMTIEQGAAVSAYQHSGTVSLQYVVLHTGNLVNSGTISGTGITVENNGNLTVSRVGTGNGFMNATVATSLSDDDEGFIHFVAGTGGNVTVQQQEINGLISTGTNTVDDVSVTIHSSTLYVAQIDASEDVTLTNSRVNGDIIFYASGVGEVNGEDITINGGEDDTGLVAVGDFMTLTAANSININAGYVSNLGTITAVASDITIESEDSLALGGNGTLDAPDINLIANGDLVAVQGSYVGNLNASIPLTNALLLIYDGASTATPGVFQVPSQIVTPGGTDNGPFPVEINDARGGTIYYFANSSATLGNLLILNTVLPQNVFAPLNDTLYISVGGVVDNNGAIACPGGNCTFSGSTVYGDLNIMSLKGGSTLVFTSDNNTVLGNLTVTGTKLYGVTGGQYGEISTLKNATWSATSGLIMNGPAESAIIENPIFSEANATFSASSGGDLVMNSFGIGYPHVRVNHYANGRFLMGPGTALIGGSENFAGSIDIASYGETNIYGVLRTGNLNVNVYNGNLVFDTMFTPCNCGGFPPSAFSYQQIITIGDQLNLSVTGGNLELKNGFSNGSLFPDCGLCIFGNAKSELSVTSGNFIMKNGSSLGTPRSGALTVTGGDVTISDSSFTSSTGISNTGGDITIRNSTVAIGNDGNFVINNTGGSITLDNSTVGISFGNGSTSITNSDGNLTITNGSIVGAGNTSGNNLSVSNSGGDMAITNQSILSAQQGDVTITNTGGTMTVSNGASITAVGSSSDNGLLSLVNSGGALTITSATLNSNYGTYSYGSQPFLFGYGPQGPSLNSSDEVKVMNDGNITISGPGNNDIFAVNGISLISADGNVSVSQIVIADPDAPNGTPTTYLTGMAGGTFSVTTTNSGISLGTIVANNMGNAVDGSITIIAGLTTLEVLPNAVLSANKGNLFLQNTLSGGGILLGEDSTLNAIDGSVYLINGALPNLPTAGTPPSNLVEQTSGGGQIYYGTAGITANAPDNHATADGGFIWFNGLTTGAIILDGNVTINAQADGTAPQLLTSLDLTDAAVIAQITDLQGQGYIGGDISLGTATITPSVLAPALTAQNIPDTFVITMQDFELTTPITVFITGNSTTSQVVVGGTQDFTSSSTGSVMQINSTETGPVLLVSATGHLTSTGDLTVGVNGNVSILGEVSATNNLTLQTTANNGNFNLNGTVSAGADLTISANGAGNIAQSGGTITATNISLMSGNGNIGALAARISAEASLLLSVTTGGNAYLQSDGNWASPISLGTTNVAGTYDLTTINNGSIQLDGGASGSISAGTMVLHAHGTGDIFQQSNNSQFVVTTLDISSDTGTIDGANGGSNTDLSVTAANLSATTAEGDIFITANVNFPAEEVNLVLVSAPNVHLSAASYFTIGNGGIVEAVGGVGDPGSVTLDMGFNLLTVESGGVLRATTEGTIAISNTSQVDNFGLISTPSGASGGTTITYDGGGFGAANVAGTGDIVGDFTVTSTNTGGAESTIVQNSVTGLVNASSDSNISVTVSTGALTPGSIVTTDSTGTITLINQGGNITFAGSTLQSAAMTNAITITSRIGSVSGSLSTLSGTILGGALYNFEITNNDTVNDLLRVATIITNAGSISLTTTQGDVVVYQNSNLFANEGNLTLRTLDVTGQITFEAGVDLTASTTGTTLGQVSIIKGTPGAPVVGVPPSPNTTGNELNGGTIYWGNSGDLTDAGTISNTVTADGTNANVIFNNQSGQPAFVIAGDDVNINSLTEQSRPDITSLDLGSDPDTGLPNDPSAITTIQQLQALHYVGGAITVDGNGSITGGNAIIIPTLLDGPITALNIPEPLSVTLVDFGAALDIDLTSTSTSKQAVVLGSLSHAQSTGLTNGFITITTDQTGPAFYVSNTGTLSSDYAIDITANGAVSVQGTISSKWLSINTSSDTISGSITLSTDVSTVNTVYGNGGPVNLNSGTTINLSSINTSGTGIGQGGRISLTAEGDISVAELMTSGGSLAGNAGAIDITSNNGSVTIGEITGTAQSGSYSNHVAINAVTGFIGANIQSGDLSIVSEGGLINIQPASSIIVTNGNIRLQNNDTVDGTIYLGSDSTISADSTMGDFYGNVYIVLGPVPSSPVVGSTPPNMNVSGSPYFGTNSITSNAPTNSITAPDSTVIFNTGTAAATAITLDGNVRIEASASGSAPVLFSLDLTDPYTVDLITQMQTAGVVGGTLVVTGGIATGGDLILAPGNATESFTAYNIPDNVTLTLEDFAVTDSLSIDITSSSTTLQAVLSGTHEFTGAGASGVFQIASTEAGPALLVSATGLLTSSGDLSVSAPSITNTGDISSSNNGTITFLTNNLVNDDVSSLIDAGGFGSVHIQPLTAGAVNVGGTTHSGVTLDITTLDLENINARNVVIGDITTTSSLSLAGNVNVSYDQAFLGLRNFNLSLLSADTLDTNGYSITMGFNTLEMQATGNASIDAIYGSGNTVNITAMGTLIINDPIEAVDPNNAFSINGNIHLSGAFVTFNLDPGENINAGTFNGVVTIDPSSSADIFFFTATQGGVNFDISEDNLNHIRTATLNIGNFTATDSITLADDVDLGFTSSYRQLNFYTNGSYEYNDFTFDAQNRSVGIYALGNINAGEMTNGSNTLTMDTLGTVTLNGGLTGFSEVTLAGSPVLLNENEITAYVSVTLRPTTLMAVNVNGSTVSGSTFDITDNDLANITTSLLTIGDGINASSMSVAADLDISGPLEDPGNFDLALISNGNFTSQGQTITLGREAFDNSASLTITTYGNAEIGAIETIADTGANVYITAGGSLNLNDDITVTGGTLDDSGRIELRGSPVEFNGHSLDAGPAGFVALAPTSDTIVAIADATGTAAPFDISASDLANIATGTLQIGDIYHTLVLNVEDDIDLSSSYDLVLVSSGAIDRTGISITRGSNNLGLSTNGGLTNLATGDLDISYLFDGNTTWRQAYNGSGDPFSIMTGGSSSTIVSNGWIDMGVDGGSITIDAGRNFNYTANGATITFVAGTSSTGGYVALGSVNLTTSGGDNDIVITGRGDPLLGMGGVQIGSISNSSVEGEVSILADSAVYVGSPSVSRVTNDFSVVADSHINVIGPIVAKNIILHAVDNNGGVSSEANLYATDSIDISCITVVQLFTINGSSYIEAPTITITTSDDPLLATVIVSEGVQIVATANIGTPGTITITTPTLSNDGLISAPGSGGNVTIQAPASTALTISAFTGGKLVADPLSGLITLQATGGSVQVTQREIAGPLTGYAEGEFNLTAQTGLVTLSDVTSEDDEIFITVGSDMQIIPGSTLVASANITLATTATNASLLISATSIESTSGPVAISNFSYVKNDSTITASSSVTIENTSDVSPDLILTGGGTLVAPTISLNSNDGAVIATQNNMQGTVNISSESTLVLSILNPSSFTPGTMTSTAYSTASLVSGFTNLYAAANSPITFGDAVFGTTTGSFGTFTVNSGVMTVTGTGNMVILIRDTDAGITSIEGISTGGGNLYFDTTAAGGLTFTGTLDTRGGADTSGGYVVLGSTTTIDTETIHTGGVGGGMTDQDRSGGAVKISASGNITVNEYIDTRGEEVGSGGNVMLISETGDITFSVSDIANGNINAVGGSGDFAEGSGGNILIGAGDAVTLNSTIDSSAELSGTSGSRGSAGWIHIAATSISSSVSDPLFGSIRANGGAEFSSASGDGGSVTLIAGTISVANYISSTGLGSGNGGDITIRAANNIDIAVADATGGVTSVDPVNGGYIVIQSDAGAITATSYIDSSASVYNQLDGGGRAGMVFVVAPGEINLISIRAEGRNKPGNETSDLPGYGGNIRIETNSDANFGFVSSSAQSTVATRAAGNGSAGRIDVLAGLNVNASTFKATGSLSGGNGGDVNITSGTGDVTTSFIFTNSPGYDIFDSDSYGNGGNVSITSAGSVSIGSFIDIGGSANFGNAGSINIQAENDITSTSYIAANGGVLGGNGGNIVLTADTGEIDYDFSFDTAARENGNGGYIVLNAQTDIFSTIVSSRGGQTGGHGGDIVLTAGGSIQTGEIDSRTEHNDLIGTSNAGDILLQANNGNIVVQGILIAAAEGVSGNAGDITVSYDNGGAAFVIDPTNNGITNGVVGTIFAQANGAGNGGAVSIFNQGGNLTVTLNSAIDVTASGNAGSINFNYEQPNSPVNSNPNSVVNVTGGEQGDLAGPVYATGVAVDISTASLGSSLILGNITATAGNINATLGAGLVLSVLPGALLTATEGNIVLRSDNTGGSSFLIGANSTLTATATSAPYGNVYIVIGPPPGSPVVGTPPSNLVVDEQNGGQVFFGTNSITANAPDNHANADGAAIVFNTDTLSATAITLDGGVTINATVGGALTLLDSLDLTDPTITALIIDLQGTMELGGTLIVDGGGIATGGNVIIAPSNLAAALTAYNIPDNVTVTMQDFTLTDVVAIDITASSSTSQAILSGTYEHTDSSPSAGVLTITSDQAGPVFLVNSTAILSSDGSLAVNVNGNITINGDVSAATTLALTTTANNGNISLNHDISATDSITLTAHGAGNITQGNLNTATSGTINFTSGTGDVGTVSNPLKISASNLTVNTGGTATSWIQNSIAVTVGSSTVGGSFYIQTNTLGADINTSGNVTSSNGTLYFDSGGAITLSHPVSGNSVVMFSFDDITLDANVSSTASIGGGVYITTWDAGNVINGSLSTISTNDSPISITANGVAFSGSVNAGTSTVTLIPNGSQAVTMGTGGGFNVSGTTMSNITAGTLIVGSTSQSGTLTISNALNVSGSGAGTFNLQFNTGSNYTAAGQTITLGSKSLTVNALGTLNTGTVTGGNSTVSMTAGTGLTVSGAVTVSSGGSITLATSNAGNISIGAALGGGTSTNITANTVGTISRSGNFTVSGTTVNLTSGNGDIGASGAELQTAAGTVTINTGGSAYIHEADGVILGTSVLGGALDFTSASGQLSVGNVTTTNGSATIIANGDIHVTDDITVTEGNLILQDMNTSSGAIVIDEDRTLSATTTGDTLGRVYIFIGTSLPSGINTTAPANVVVNNTNTGVTYFGTNSITASAPDNTVNTNGSVVLFDTGSLAASAISLGGNVTINGTSQPSVEGPIYSLDFTDPNLTALIISLQGSEEVGGTLIVDGNGIATGGNAIIGSNMLANTLTSTNIPTGVTITFDGFTVSDAVAIDIDEESYSPVAIISGTLQFDTSGSPSGGLITINSDQASASGNPAFVLTGTGQLLSDGSLSLSASGNMILQGDVSAATDLTLATTANNGNINITGDVAATNSATLSLNGNGTVTGIIDTPSLNFSSSMGNLGTSSGNPFVTNADSLAVNTGGNAYINNTSTGTLTLGATSARNLELTNNDAVVISSTLTTSQSAYILVTDNDGGVTLNGNFTAPNWMAIVADGTGDIVQNGGSIRSSSLYLATGSGDIGSSGSSIQTNAFYTTFITSGGDVYLNSSNSVRIHNASSGDTVDITSNGSIDVAAPINSSGSVTFHGAGSIVLHADITASSFVSLFGNGHGNILNNGGSVITPTITTSTSTGSIGTDVAPIETTAENITSTNLNDAHIATSSTPNTFNVTANYVSLTLNVTGDLGSFGTPFITTANQLTLNVLGAAYVYGQSSLLISNSSVSGTTQIWATDNLTVNNLVTTSGSITLTAQTGVLTITEGATIQANEGNVSLHSNSSTGTIFIGNGALVKGFTVDNLSFGNVSITVWSSVGTSGSAPGNVTENIVEDGQIIIGNNGFTSNNSGNTLDALDRTITIDAGAAGSIILDGNVTISADPPIAQVTAPSQIANILPLLSITNSSTNSSNTTLGTTNVMVQPVVLDTTVITRPLNINSDQYQLINLNPAPVDDSAADEPVYKPIAYTTTTAPAASTIVNSTRELSHADFGSCSVRHAGADVTYNEAGVVNLNSGEVLIHSPRHTTVQAGDYSISVDPGSVALITKEGSLVKVRALHESHMNAIVVTAGNDPIKVSVGQEVMLAPHSTHLQVAAQKDGLGRRHVVDAQLPSGHAMSRSEFSHMTLIEKSHVLTKLVQSKSPADKQLADKLVKTAACLMTVTGSHGAFSGK